MKNDSEFMNQALMAVLDEMCLTLSRVVDQPGHLTDPAQGWRKGSIEMICKQDPDNPRACMAFHWKMDLRLARSLVSRFLGQTPEFLTEDFAWDAIREVQNVTAGRYLDMSGKSSIIDLGIPAAMEPLAMQDATKGEWQWLEVEDLGHLAWMLEILNVG